MPRDPATSSFLLPPEAEMDVAAQKLRAAYAITPGIPFYRREFGYYCLDRWYEQGLSPSTDLATEFDYDPPGSVWLGGLGGCEAPFDPLFEPCVIEDRGEHEVVQDTAGRHVLCFKGRRNGFMPEYLDHPVRNWQTWEERCKWRLDPTSPSRRSEADARMREASPAARRGLMMTQYLVGGYMYLRSLMGPEGILYAVCETPDLVHDCMKSWLAVTDAVTAMHQEHVTLDEILFDEDICYKNGALISPDMMREFLFPYYQQLLSSIRARQGDPDRKLFIHVATDGWCAPVIPLYREEIGMNVMSPFEVAAGCDVVRIGRDFPDLVIYGGIDKRVLAESPFAIDCMLERILPPMLARGGYIPNCDHGVPEEVTLDLYRHYRKRCVELGG
jgi:uroporphyrinogen decarboxylase